MPLPAAAPDGEGRAGRRSVLGVERSATGRRWVERLDHAGHQSALAIGQRYELPDLLARVVAARGVGIDDVADHLAPSLRALLPDPSRLAGMDEAAERLATAIRRGERVAIFGDYDVDGATSAALLTRFLRFNSIDPQIHIPDRIVEGYGPNVPAIEALAASGTGLLVTVDCGATSFEPLARAAELGMDVVVADHHQMGEALPPAQALVNPNRQDDLSGQGHLAAVGVVFLLLVATNRALRQAGWYGGGRREPDLLAWLDLVALGTVADVVPLVGVNRAFVQKGLVALRRRQFVGLTALCEAARISSPVDCYHLGFLLGPRINAGGRIGDAGLGVTLLLCEERTRAVELAGRLEDLNRERQEIERQILDAALASLGEPGDDVPAVIVAHSGADWHPGVLGLVATRVKDRFRRPAFALSFGEDGTGTGSGRSVPGVDLGAIVRAAVAEGLLVKGGGHAMAAGVTLTRDRLAAFTEFARARAGEGSAEATAHHLSVDGALTAGAASVELIDRLEQAGPYGQGAPEPVVALPAHRLAFAETTEQGHVRCRLLAPDGSRIAGIAFRAMESDLGPALVAARGEPVHAAGSLKIDDWGGRRSPVLRLRDVARPTRG